MAEVKHSQRKHALLSASGASRWIACTPSARLEEEMNVEDTSSVFAEEGTLAHEFGDIELNYAVGNLSKKEYTKQLKKLRSNKLYTDEMEEEVQKYTDYVLEQFGAAKKITPDAVLSIEDRVDLTHYVDEGFGTNDAMVIADQVLEVTDLKYGKGVKVDADENPQLMLYGLGALRKNSLLFDIKTVRLTIVQPRLDHISSWEIPAKDLIRWGVEVVRPKAKEAFEGVGEFKAGDHCRWCDAKPRCRALADLNLKIAQKEFAEPKLLSDSELLEVFEQSSILSDWVDAVDKHVLSEALDGKKWEGYKLVEGRSKRKWIDEEIAINKISEKHPDKDILNVKIKGIGAIEKEIGKVSFSELAPEIVVKPNGKPTLVPESDKRAEYSISTCEKDFKN